MAVAKTPTKVADKNTDFLDLDSVEPEDKNLVVKLDGVSHTLSRISLEDWIANTKAIQGLKLVAGDMEAEADVMIGMIVRSFKTMDGAALKKLPLFKLNKILEIARNNNGERKADAEVEAVKENPPEPTPTAS